MDNYFPRSTTFVSHHDPDMTISIDDVNMGIYEMSDGQTLSHQELLTGYTPMTALAPPLSERNITGDGIDSKLKNEILKNKNTFGLDIVTERHHIENELEQKNTTTFDFNKPPESNNDVYVYNAPSEKNKHGTELPTGKNPDLVYKEDVFF